MTFTQEQKKEAYKKLSVEIQDFVMSSETTELIENYLDEAGLTEEQSTLADSEILWAMFNLQTLSDAIINIAKQNNRGPEYFSKLKVNLQKNVFSEINGYVNTTKSTTEENQETKNDKIQKNTPDQIRYLPKANQDFLLNGLWKERTNEIAKKYSLNEKKAGGLTDNVLSVLIGSVKPDDLLEVFIHELGISRLLAEQIMEDLEVRVFEYATKTIQNQEKKSESVEKTEDDDLPEVRPEITPMIEPAEKVRVRPVPVGFTDTAPKPISIPQPSASGPRQFAPELVQRPVSVPRYTGVPMEEEKGSSQGLAASSKEGAEPIKEPPHQSAPGPQTSATPQPVPELVKKYAVDPYREPLD